MKTLLRLQALLRMEYEAEKAEYQLQTEQMPVARKVRRGICWFPVRVGRSYYNSLNQLVAEVEREVPEDEEDNLVDHQFEYGRPVAFFACDEEHRCRLLPSAHTISYVDGNRMVVTMPGEGAVASLSMVERLGVQLYFDETSYQTMFHALGEVLAAKHGRLAELRDVFAGRLQPRSFAFSDMRFPWLNPTQEEAVNKVLRAKDVAVVHGPPGTGKTTTLVEAIHETLRRETQVMVCAQSNMAVDWISEKLVDYGISVLRIGNPTRVNEKMLSFTYERRFENHPDYPDLWALRKAIRQLRAQKKKGEAVHQKVARLRERAAEIEMRIHESLFSQARVVACTLVGSANKLLVGQHFPTLFIDEAAQALEPACWIAIRRAGRVVLAGDHQQLPPTVKCFEAQKQGLGVTLMERIVRNVPSAVTLLTVQYRMNERIMRFSSDWFYNGQVEASPTVRMRSILDLDRPIEWIDTSPFNAADFAEQFVGEGHSRINPGEAALVVQTLVDYIRKIGPQRFRDERFDVGIITPYRMQAHLIRRLIKQSEPLRQLFGGRHLTCTKSAIAPISADAGGQRGLKLPPITVNTVDGFQGQERDIILISLVRSNPRHQIGFLGDLRRMNVAITRARMKLIIIAHAATLDHHPFYRRLREFVEEE